MFEKHGSYEKNCIKKSFILYLYWHWKIWFKLVDWLQWNTFGEIKILLWHIFWFYLNSIYFEKFYSREKKFFSRTVLLLYFMFIHHILSKSIRNRWKVENVRYIPPHFHGANIQLGSIFQVEHKFLFSISRPNQTSLPNVRFLSTI